MSREVRKEPDENRYVIFVDGERVGLADYEIDGDRILFTHTEVDPAKREKRLASELVQWALDDVRASTELRVVAVCPYVKDWIGKHPEYEDLLRR